MRRIKRTKAGRAYDVALNYCCRLLEAYPHDRYEYDDEWALLRCVWKVQLGLDPSKAQIIEGHYVDV